MLGRRFVGAGGSSGLYDSRAGHLLLAGICPESDAWTCGCFHKLGLLCVGVLRIRTLYTIRAFILRPLILENPHVAKQAAIDAAAARSSGTALTSRLCLESGFSTSKLADLPLMWGITSGFSSLDSAAPQTRRQNRNKYSGLVVVFCMALNRWGSHRRCYLPLMTP